MGLATAAVAAIDGGGDYPIQGFVSIQVEMLRRLRHAAVDLFVRSADQGEPLLYCRAGLPLESQRLFGLSDAGVRFVYVRDGDFQDFGAHLLESVEADRERGEVPHNERFAALQLALAVEIERTSRLADCGHYVKLSREIGPELTSLLASSNVLPRELFRLARHDFNTFTHVTNVAGYCVVLAERLGIGKVDELTQIATAAMLHDVGKRFIPASILNKPARLNPAERAVIETHPQRGYEDLCRRGGMTFGQLMMIYQHHERVDGKGYPVGVTGEEIHPWAKMLAVVDVFDAMTGTRPYRRAATTGDALGYIRQNSAKHFDAEVVQCWISAMNVT
jgi:HD-GYP domain-containing protein (c-di-GMP phosphodiesterase class II)